MRLPSSLAYSRRVSTTPLLPFVEEECVCARDTVCALFGFPQNTALDAATLVDGLSVAVVQDACSSSGITSLGSPASEAALARAGVRIVSAADVIAAAAECEEATGQQYSTGSPKMRSSCLLRGHPSTIQAFNEQGIIQLPRVLLCECPFVCVQRVVCMCLWGRGAAISTPSVLELRLGLLFALYTGCCVHRRLQWSHACAAGSVPPCGPRRHGRRTQAGRVTVVNVPRGWWT